MPNQIKSTTSHQPQGAQQRISELATAEMQPTQDISDYLKEYARQRPEVAALWCLGIGFILGWKLKPW